MRFADNMNRASSHRPEPRTANPRAFIPQLTTNVCGHHCGSSEALHNLKPSYSHHLDQKSTAPVPRYTHTSFPSNIDTNPALHMPSVPDAQQTRRRTRTGNNTPLTAPQKVPQTIDTNALHSSPTHPHPFQVHTRTRLVPPNAGMRKPLTDVPPPRAVRHAPHCPGRDPTIHDTVCTAIHRHTHRQTHTLSQKKNIGNTKRRQPQKPATKHPESVPHTSRQSRRPQHKPNKNDAVLEAISHPISTAQFAFIIQRRDAAPRTIPHTRLSTPLICGTLARPPTAMALGASNYDYN